MVSLVPVRMIDVVARGTVSSRAISPIATALALLVPFFGGCRAPAVPSAAVVPPPDPPPVSRDAVGLNLHADRLPADEAERRFDAVLELGVRHVRVAVEWMVLEPQPGEFDWTRLDRIVDLAEERGIDVLQVLCYNAAWNSATPGDTKTRPVDMDAWRRFVRASARRYRGRITAWEVWNEPNIDVFLRGDYAAEPERRWTDYRDILAAAREELEAVDPDNVVVFGGLAHGSEVWQQDLEAYYEVGAIALCDVLAIHPYAGGDPADPRWYPRYIDEILQTMARHGDADREVWITEIGIPTDGHELAVSEEQQSLYLPSYFRVALARTNITRVYWYDLHDEGGEHFGVLRGDGKPKPAAAALRSLFGPPR